MSDARLTSCAKCTYRHGRRRATVNRAESGGLALMRNLIGPARHLAERSPSARRSQTKGTAESVLCTSAGAEEPWHHPRGQRRDEKERERRATQVDARRRTLADTGWHPRREALQQKGEDAILLAGGDRRQEDMCDREVFARACVANRFAISRFVAIAVHVLASY